MRSKNLFNLEFSDSQFIILFILRKLLKTVRKINEQLNKQEILLLLSMNFFSKILTVSNLFSIYEYSYVYIAPQQLYFGYDFKCL